MEDEKCDVGSVCSGDVSEPPVIVNLPGETILEDVETDERVEESCEDKDGGEVMVEVVGSDVFVDGVSGRKERAMGPREVCESQVHGWENQDLQRNVGGSCEESKLEPVAYEKQDLSMVESVNSENCVITESPCRGVEVLDEVVGNRAAETTPIFSSTMGFSTATNVEAIEQTSVVVGEDMMSDDISLDKECVNVMSGLLNHADKPTEQGGSVIGTKNTLNLCNSSCPCLDLMGAKPVTSRKVVHAGTSDVCAPSVALCNANCDAPGSVQVDGFSGVIEGGFSNTNTVDQSGNAGSDHDNSVDLNLIVVANNISKGEVSCANTERIGATGDGSKDSKEYEKGVASCATAISDEEIAADFSSEGDVSWVNAESIGGNGDGSKDAKVNEAEVAVADTEHPVHNLDTFAPNVQDENLNSKKYFDGKKYDATHEIHGIPLPGLESSQEHFVSSEKKETAGVDIDGVLDFEDGEISCMNNQEYPKLDGNREIGVVQQNLVFPNEPYPEAFGVNYPEINKDKGAEIRIPSEIEANLNNATNSSATNSSHAGEVEIQVVGSDRNAGQPTTNFPDAEVIDDKSVAVLEVKAVVQSESSKNDNEVDDIDIENVCISHLATSEVEIHNLKELDDHSRGSNDNHIADGHTSEETVMDIEEIETGPRYSQDEVDCSESEVETDETASEVENVKFLIEEPENSDGPVRMNQSSYLTPSVNEGQFSLSDLVWGKVRSYPWWPGQIFDPTDASEKAVKHCKKESYLVAYFGDRTFAWNEASVLKPFRPNFSLIEKQSNSEAFQNAVNCALEEVSRRVELGLACSCVPKDAYDKIKIQVVENTGIRGESSQRKGMDQSCSASSFEPNELLDYVKSLAPCASSGAHRLDLVISQAQLSAFCRFKSYRLPAEFPSSGELLEHDVDNVELSDEMVVSHKRNLTPKNSLLSGKERSLTELMGDAAYSPDYEDETIAKDTSKSISLTSGIKRKSIDTLADGPDRKVSAFAAKVSTPTPKPSFKIGECIRRVASQLTSSASMGKSHTDDNGNDGSLKIYEQHPEKQSVLVSAESSLNEMFSQLQLLAQDPSRKHIFLNKILPFFSCFRRSIALNRRGKKKKTATAVGGSVEEFEFDDVNDSYWTDRIIQNYSEDQLLNNCENGTANLQVVPFAEEKSVKSGRKSHSRKRFSTSSYQAAAATEFDENVKRRKQESSPAELILNFVDRLNVPSEINLNKMFRRFGPLMESETEVDHDTGRAKVIFKRGSDAEVAHSSAMKFNIFGPMRVNYEIGYSPLISVRILPLSVPHCQEDPTAML